MDETQVREHFAFLRVFATAQPEQRIAIAKTISENQIEILSQSCYNLLLNERVDPSEEERAKLRRQQGIIKRVASRDVSTSGERKKLIQRYSKLMQRVAAVVSRNMKV